MSEPYKLWQKRASKVHKKWERSTALHAKPFDPKACEEAHNEWIAMLDAREAELRND